MVLLVLILLSCSGGSGIPNLPPDENPDRYTFAASDKTRNTSPEVPPSDLAALVNGNTAFACDLLQQLKDSDGNIFFSPFSISQALAMTWTGTRSDTESQISDTMHFELPQADLHPAFNLLDLELQSRGEGAAGKDSEGFRLNIANSTWGQQGWTWLPGFLDTLAVNYGAGMRLVDFMTQPDQCRIIINDWVADRTEGRIVDLLPEGVIDSATALVLVNAIYFNAAWLEPFEESMTANGPFYLLDGTSVDVPLMLQSEEHEYMEGDGYRALDISYDGDELSMLIILPDTGRYEEIESSIDVDFLDNTISILGNRQVTVTMPKWEFESNFGLADTLYDMGIEDAFMPVIADLSGMDGTRLLYITDVVHKAFVAVDEAGTEAAAATGVVVGYTSAPMPATFNADRPFVFLIRDKETGTILFMGRVLNPGD